MKILVCDDNLMITKAIVYKLKSVGYEVDVALDGNQAVEKIHQSDYDMVITDLLMPYYGGLELINIARNVLNLNIPILVLSIMDNEDSVIEAFKMGADDYITKPFSPNEFLLRVKRLLVNR